MPADTPGSDGKLYYEMETQLDSENIYRVRVGHMGGTVIGRYKAVEGRFYPSYRHPRLKTVRAAEGLTGPSRWVSVREGIEAQLDRVFGAVRAKKKLRKGYR